MSSVMRVARFGLAATTVSGCAAAGYIAADPGRRRSFAFWSRLGPVVGSYVGTALAQKYWYNASKAERREKFNALHEENAPRVLAA